MSDPLTVLLSQILSKTILVGAVLLVAKFSVEGYVVPAASLFAALVFFAYLVVTDATLLE